LLFNQKIKIPVNKTNEDINQEFKMPKLLAVKPLETNPKPAPALVIIDSKDKTVALFLLSIFSLI